MGYHRASFGVGSVTAIDANGATNDIAVVQGIDIEFKSTEEPLKGNQLMPIDSATTGVEITGKIQTSDSAIALVPLVVPGTTSATGRRKMRTESSVIPTTPYQVTVTKSASFASNLGVVDLTSGKPLKKVVSAPATGEFSVAAGVYTFAAADTGHTVAIRYSHTDTDGQTITGTNQTVGATAGYQLEVYDPQEGTREQGYLFFSVKFQDLSGGMKPGKWSESSIGFTVNTNAQNKAFELYID